MIVHYRGVINERALLVPRSPSAPEVYNRGDKGHKNLIKVGGVTIKMIENFNNIRRIIAKHHD